MAKITAEFSAGGADVHVEVTASNIAKMVYLEEEIRKFLISLLSGAKSTDEPNAAKSSSA
jgi:hypothetical protein